MQIMQMSDWLVSNNHQQDASCKVDLGDSKSDSNDDEDCSTKSAEFVSLLTLVCIAVATLVAGFLCFACCGRRTETQTKDYARKSSMSAMTGTGSTAEMKKSTAVQEKV
mmetsp:Transcript_20472/g.38502  ORF Transcript_20472/g.38502 Transcript_20472/m.38502 type:complete len:109 (-) Transcript_20472:517-843(-)